ncbi:type II secretion system F family protein [Stenotrophomonas sp. BIGb0135]|jgi:tight adherence protein C|uniref:type II secretion system F family protein n=1 Tax=Stenotrophomonas sp. BIGb0135 TaxID=2940620 RepID=UPI002169BD60|nr:type II secretion system F family protein [Stenotrophomonas sp. BIGb0135]MCS4233247.1 tight adherence protein C [Stenotrophomonas sp. BIGb0135]
MSADSLLILALLLLALGVGLLGMAGLWLSGQQQRTAATLQTALRNREDAPRDAATAATAATAANTPTTADAGPRGWAWLASLGERFNGGRLEAALLAPEDRLLLDQAGWHTRAGTASFLALRLLLAVLCLVLAMLFYRGDGLSRLVVMLGALGTGVLLPKFALRAWATRLRKRVSAELPLLIDLLRLLQGVGFSMDQSLQTLGDKLRSAIPVLGREIQQANIAYMHGRTRQQSLRRLAESFDDEDLRSLVQLMLQVHEHGGAVQEPLRQFSVRLREQRRSTLKEKVGKLSVKMTVVMMLTLLPALMLVLSGPAIIALANAVNRLG